MTTAGAQFTWVPASFLEGQKVEPWSDMPVWIPPAGEYAGFAARQHSKRALDKGLTFRSLADTPPGDARVPRVASGGAKG